MPAPSPHNTARTALPRGMPGPVHAAAVIGHKGLHRAPGPALALLTPSRLLLSNHLRGKGKCR
jgi:hypothetical protein